MRVWTQFRDLGLPRCSDYDPENGGKCGRFIWPWQDWVCEVEAWPSHHSCHHRHTEWMLEWNLKDEASDRHAGTMLEGYHWDGYDECRFCGRTTPLPERASA